MTARKRRRQGSRSSELSGEARVHTYLRGLRGIARDIEVWRAFFEIIPHALRDAELRPRLVAMYAWYRELTAVTCGLYEIPLDPERRNALATMILATLDGLALQVALDPDSVEPALVFELLFTFVRGSLESAEEGPGRC
jgi:hypothetical protein